MKTNPFETIRSWLSGQEMSHQEKRRMRQALLSYVTTHPVRSGLLSPYAFHYATAVLASLVLVLGGSVGITSAAAHALPNQKLYPVKIWIEEFQAKSQKTPEDVIAFETKRISRRFDEATELAINHELDGTTSQVIQSGLEHSRAAIKDVADAIQDQDPELALAATNTLETTFSSNGKILASIERNTNQNIGTIVLAAQVTTDKLAVEKSKFEKIVALKPNDTTKAAAVAKLTDVTARLGTLAPSDDTVDGDTNPADAGGTNANDARTAPKAAASDDIQPTGDAETNAKDIAEPTADATIVAATDTAPESGTDEKSITSAVTLTKKAPSVDAAARTLLPTTALTKPADASDATTPGTSAATAVQASGPGAIRKLSAAAQQKMAAGRYSEALVILQKASQMLDEATLTKTLEATYKVQVRDGGTADQTPASAQTEAPQP